jgi:hypothetical protein
MNTRDAETRRLAAILDMPAPALACWSSRMSTPALAGLAGDLETAETVFEQLEGPAANRPGSCTCRTRFARKVLGDARKAKAGQYSGPYATTAASPIPSGGLGGGDPAVMADDTAGLGSWLSKAFRSVTKAASNVFGIVRNVAGGLVNNIPIVGPLVGGLLDRFAAPGQTPAPTPPPRQVNPGYAGPVLPPAQMPYTSPGSGGGGPSIFAPIDQPQQQQAGGGLSLSSPVVLVGLAAVALLVLSRR